MNDSTANSVRHLIEARQEELGLSDGALGQAVGYHGNVIAAIKSGAIRLPVNKVGATAGALRLDVVTLLRTVLMESSPELWHALEPLLPLGQLAPAEVNLIRHLRKTSAQRPLAPIVLEGSSVIALVVTP